MRVMETMKHSLDQCGLSTSALAFKQHHYSSAASLEQHRIVAKVDALMVLCDALETHLIATREAQEAFAAAAVHHLDV